MIIHTDEFADVLCENLKMWIKAECPMKSGTLQQLLEQAILILELHALHYESGQEKFNKGE